MSVIIQEAFGKFLGSSVVGTLDGKAERLLGLPLSSGSLVFAGELGVDLF